MKMRMLALLLVIGLLFGTICGCDYVMDETSGTTVTTADEGDTTTATKPVTTTTIRRTTTTTKKVTAATAKRTTEKTAEAMVWIPASGSKYHSKSSCSNMKNPSQVTKSRAIEMGYSPCKKCY